jgi:MGT family glycosyltransferase
MPLNFLFTSWGNPGNLNPLLTAARRLRQRGHRVRFLGEADHYAETTRAGFDALSWQRPRPPTPPDPDCEDPNWEEVRMILGQITFGGAVDYAADTMDALRSEAADAVVTNDLLAGPAIAAEALGIPYALLSPHVSIRPLEGIPPGGAGLVPDGSPRYYAEERAARARQTELMQSYLPMLNGARAEFGLAPLGHVFDHYDRADRLFIGLSPAFDFPAQRLPSNLRYVGPLLDMPEWAQPWSAPWSGLADRPRVLVSLSTSFQHQAEVLRQIVRALGTMDLDAVVTVGPAMQGEAIKPPANVTVLASAPHDTVMKEVSLVVTHGGHGTLTRALVNGVPLLVLPMGRDQGANAARVVARGAGLALSGNATPEEIVIAVERLVTEPAFKAAAQRLGEAIAPDVTSPIFAGEMEAIASHSSKRRSA